MSKFHLGKKAYVIGLAEPNEAIIFGADDYDPTSHQCILRMMYVIHDAGETFDIDAPGDGAKTLFSYDSKSSRFTSGSHSEGDGRRYLKSRYRDFLRQFNRVHDPDQRVAILEEQARSHEQDSRRNSRRQTVAA